ncbi:MAG: HAD family hydrolase [Acidimicrobiia bacterium]|nr:HAD family hydrolase [Acidimicrobiia bacterium]
MSGVDRIETVVFDWGGTLSIWAEVEVVDMWRLAATHIAEQTGAGCDELVARLVEVEGRMWEEGTTRDFRSFTLSEIMQTASRELGIDVAEAVLEEAALHHLDTWTPHVRHDPEAVETLAGLHERGIRIGLLSNTHWPEAWHEHFLERDGLAPFIDVRVYSSEEEHMKPHPRIFELALERLDSGPRSAVMVGDRQLDDVKGAQQVGMRGVWKHTRLAKQWPGVEPDFEVQRLPELLDLVDRLR